MSLPPPALVKTWIVLLQCPDITDDIKFAREKVIIQYFGSVELADYYIDECCR